MEECLITNIVCSNSNKKCKICKLDKCKEVLNMIDVQQTIEDKYKILEIKKKLPKECKNCTLKNGVVNTVTNIKNGIVDRFNTLKTGAINIVTNIKNGIVDKFNSAKNTVLEYIDLHNKKVRCFYKIKDRCILK